jgi:hypothetical protein
MPATVRPAAIACDIAWNVGQRRRLVPGWWRSADHANIGLSSSLPEKHRKRSREPPWCDLRTGMVFYGRGSGGIPTCPKLDLAAARRECELQIARDDDLHCNAVRLIGRDVDKLVQIAERALALVLEVWLSPALWGRSPGETLHYRVSAAERLRQQHPNRIVFVLGSQLTLLCRESCRAGTSPSALARHSPE